MSAPKYKGVQVDLGGQLYTVPPLTLGAIEDNEERIRNVEILPHTEQLRLTIDLAHAALRRNYPELTRDEVRELIDLGTAGAVYAAVMSVSVPKADPGEAPAVASGTGQPSTPTSQPASAGPSTTAASESPSTTCEPLPPTGPTTPQCTSALRPTLASSPGRRPKPPAAKPWPT